MFSRNRTTGEKPDTLALVVGCVAVIAVGAFILGSGSGTTQQSQGFRFFASGNQPAKQALPGIMTPSGRP
jgi:hypothetical protein